VTCYVAYLIYNTSARHPHLLEHALGRLHRLVLGRHVRTESGQVDRISGDESKNPNQPKQECDSGETRSQV